MSKIPKGSRISTCEKAQIKGDKSTAMPRMINFLTRIIHTRQMGLARMDYNMFEVLKTFRARRPKALR